MIASAHRRSHRTCAALLAVALVSSFVAALLLGAVTVPPLDVLRAMVGIELPGYRMEIIQSIRLPRALLAASVGAILAICGAILKGLFRNPLAYTYLIEHHAVASAGSLMMHFIS